MELYPFTKNFFRKTFVQYVTVWLLRIWTHENTDEKAHTLSKRSKNVKKRTKTYKKRILCKFTLNLRLILLMKGFLQLVAQFSSNLFAELGTASFFLSPQSANPQSNFNFLNPQPQVRNWTFKSLVRNRKSATS